jgi:beta-mannanase
MQDGANGQFNSYWVALSQDLTNFFQTENGVSTSRVIIRTGWECYGNWYPWSEYVAGGPTYAEYFRQIVTSMRSVSGANFKFSWNCGTGVDAGDSTHPNTDTSDAAYPGDAYVDYLDFDAYDVPNFVSTVINGNHGLAWWVNFAAQHGKYLAFSEWGEQDETGDDPAYIQTMYNFFYNPANRVAYADYHNLQPNGLVNFPNSAAMYTSLFKGTPQRYVANRVVENLAKIRNVT